MGTIDFEIMEKPEGNAVDCKKRKTDVDEDEDLDDFSPDELAKLSRSERKRHREKKRRSDVNKGFDDLMTLLLEIDPTVRTEAEERSRRGNWKGTYGAEDNLLSRVDLIDRAVEVLRRIHCENEDRKLMISSLTRSKGSEGSLDIGFLAQPASQNRSLAAATNPTNQEVRIVF